MNHDKDPGRADLTRMHALDARTGAKVHLRAVARRETWNRRVMSSLHDLRDRSFDEWNKVNKADGKCIE